MYKKENQLRTEDRDTRIPEWEGSTGREMNIRVEKTINRDKPFDVPQHNLTLCVHGGGGSIVCMCSMYLYKAMHYHIQLHIVS